MLHRRTSSTLHSGPTFFLQPRQLNSASVRPAHIRGDAECNHGNKTGRGERQRQRVDHADGELMSPDEKRAAMMKMRSSINQKVGHLPVPISRGA